MKNAALLILAATLLAAFACGPAGDRRDVEQAARDYFQAISTQDPRLLCERIDSDFGFFTDEKRCLEVQTYTVVEGGALGPLYSEDAPFRPVPLLGELHNVIVTGDRAWAVAAVRWSAEHNGERRSFGESRLSMRLVHSDGSWRVASFENAAVSPSTAPDVEAVTQAVFDHYQAFRREVGTGFYVEIPTGLGEHRDARNVLSKMVTVRFKEGYAAATIDVHIIDNGAIGRPSRFELVLGSDGNSWHVVANTDPAYALFDE